MFKMNQVLIISLVVFAANAATLDRPDSRVFGGYRAVPGQFPHQISIRVNFTGEFEHNCGGSIITDRFIVTAAHCFLAEFPYDMNRYRLIIGAHNRTGDGEEYLIQKNFIHPDWDLGRIINDIALAFTERVILFSENVQPISISSKFIQPGYRAVTSGWGVTDVRTSNGLSLLAFH